MKISEFTIKVTNLTIGYKQTKGRLHSVLENINLDGKQGEIIALVGANGRGKSTLLKTFSRLLQPLSGEILFYGKLLQDIQNKELAMKVSFTKAVGGELTNMSVFELVAMGRIPYTNWIGSLTENDKLIILEALYDVGLEGFDQRRMIELSDGEKQKVLIARSLVQDTELILLDEPTAFLDLSNKYEIVFLLKKIAKEKNKCIIFSTHDLHIATKHADKMWLIYQKTILQAAPEDLILDGHFEKIFTNTNLKFDYKTGEFIPSFVQKRKIRLVGEGRAFLWTQKALERAGFELNELEKNVLQVKKINNYFVWELNYSSEVYELRSIYELLRILS